MGLLDKWLKKKEKSQLKATQEKEPDIEIKKKDAEPQVKSRKEKKEETKKSEKPKTDKKKEEKKEEKKEPVVPKTKKTGKVNLAHKVLVRPVVSERAAKWEGKGVYTFIVNKNTNKIEIKKAVEQVYGVKPSRVRVINMDGKTVRFGRQYGRRGQWKKAMVYLPKGQSINIHEGV